jgi:hypothetical protein
MRATKGAVKGERIIGDAFVGTVTLAMALIPRPIRIGYGLFSRRDMHTPLPWQQSAIRYVALVIAVSCWIDLVFRLTGRSPLLK